MASIRRRDTGPEVLLRRELWRCGLRGWRCDVRDLPGRPDVVFRRHRVAVFVDGLLWHGHPRRYPARLDAAWLEKIARNIRRDREADARLRMMAWNVVRIWDDDLRRDLPGCVHRITTALAASELAQVERMHA